MYVDILTAAQYNIVMNKLYKIKKDLFRGDEDEFVRDCHKSIFNLLNTANKFLGKKSHINMFKRATKKSIRTLRLIESNRKFNPDMREELVAMIKEIQAIEVMVDLTKEV